MNTQKHKGPLGVIDMMNLLRVVGVVGLLSVCLTLSACSDSASKGTDGGIHGDGGGGDDGGVDGGEDGGTPSPLLDVDFGQNGVAWASSAWSTDVIYAACRHDDGTITLGGTTVDFGHSAQLLLGRFTPDGEPYESFGSGGQVKIPLFGLSRVTDMAALDDGGLLVAGTAYGPGNHAFLARLNAEGTLDTSFASTGFLVVDGDYHGNPAVAVDGQGRALFMVTDSSVTTLRRYLMDGSPDDSFGTSGERGLAGEESRKLKVLSDGKILALTVNYDDAVLQRLNVDGSTDETFTTVSTEFLAHDFAVAPDGAGILLAGPADYDSNVLLKVTADGVPDATFGTDGVLQVDASSALVVVEWLESGEIFLVDASMGNYPNCVYFGIIRLDGDGTELAFHDGVTGILNGEVNKNLFHEGGELYLAGGQRLSIETSAHGDERMSVVGFTADGSALSSYGTDGLAQINSLGAPEVMWSMLMHSDGSVIASASAATYGVLVRFQDGEHDSAFGGDGFADDYHSQFTKIREDPEGRIVALGWTGGLIRFGADGTWEEEFSPEILPGQGRDFAVDDSGRYVVAGGVVGGNGTFMLARYLPDGNLDPDFGDAGVVLGLDGKDGFAIAIHLDDAGRIVTTGEIYPQGGFPYPFIARFNADGTPDTSFGVDGLVSLEGSNYVSRIVTRASGGYLVTTQGPFSTTLQVYAVDDSGALIPDFGAGGHAELEFTESHLHALLELDDGRILVAKSVLMEHHEEMAVRCLLPNGQPDTSFDSDGLFVYPGQGRAVALVPDGDGVLVGGFLFNAQTGSDVVVLRIMP